MYKMKQKRRATPGCHVALSRGWARVTVCAACRPPCAWLMPRLSPQQGKALEEEKPCESAGLRGQAWTRRARRLQAERALNGEERKCKIPSLVARRYPSSHKPGGTALSQQWTCLPRMGGWALAVCTGVLSMRHKPVTAAQGDGRPNCGCPCRIGLGGGPGGASEASAPLARVSPRACRIRVFTALGCKYPYTQKKNVNMNSASTLNMPKAFQIAHASIQHSGPTVSHRRARLSCQPPPPLRCPALACHATSTGICEGK